MKSAHDVRSDPATLDVKHLKLVREIAAGESVTRAAGRLHLTQSAVSHQLIDLERDLGTRLFDRVGKRMVPTGAGAKILAASERLLGELASLERDIQDLRLDTPTPLRVTTSCYTSYHWLPSALSRFAATHPRIDITIVLEATRRANEALANDEVDVIIVNDPPREETWSTAPLVTSELVALVSPTHPILTRRRKDVVKWGDLRGMTVLVHDISERLAQMLTTAVRDSWERESGERLADPVAIRRIPLTEALIELARARSGVAIADRWIVGSHISKTLIALTIVPRAKRTFYAVWRRANPRQLPIRELVSVIEESAMLVERAGLPKRRKTP